MILLTDEEDRTMAIYFSAAAAVRVAERNGWYALACHDSVGRLKNKKVFWYAELNLSTNEISIGTTEFYRWGSATRPCRHGIRTPAGRPTQRLGSIVAWGADAKTARYRVKRQAKEGRKRAARDETWERIEKEVRNATPGILWDPYGLW